jgi:replicative DNA helicase
MEATKELCTDFGYKVGCALASAQNAAHDVVATTVIDTAKDVTEGKPEILYDEMISLAKQLGLPESLLEEFFKEYQQQTTEAQEAAKKEQEKQARRQLADGLEQSAQKYKKAVEDNDTQAEQAAVEELDDLSTKLKKEPGIEPTTRARLITFENYCNSVKSYDPTKQFLPELFGNIRFPNGTMSLIGARTSRGKTSAMINLARNAIDTGRKVLFISLEESGRKIFNRLMLSTAYATAKAAGVTLARENPVVDLWLLENGQSIPKANKDDKTATDFTQYRNEAHEKIKAANTEQRFLLYDGRTATVEEILNAVTAYTDKGTVVLLDYIQKMPLGSQNADTYKRMAETTNSILEKVIKSDAVAICGAQFNRACGIDKKGADTFKEDNFRESGDLEQDAEIAIGIGREPENDKRRFYEVLKNREGESGMAFYLDFAGAFSYMERGDQRTKQASSKAQGNTEMATAKRGKEQKTGLANSEEEPSDWPL